MATVWKIAPGDDARVWEETQEQRCITVNPNKKADLSKLSREKLKETFGQGFGDSLWQFIHEVRPQHTVVANKGNHRVVGIGVIDSAYLPPGHLKNPRNGAEDHWHARLANWEIAGLVDLHDKMFFGRFVPDTVMRLSSEQCRKIKQAYLKACPNDPTLGEKLDRLLDGKSFNDPALVEDLQEIAAGNVDATTKAALVNARIGQGAFRVDVLQLWGNCCSATGSLTMKAIRASHVKPWRESTDQERLDPYNGLPLVASLDALFDAGLISFDRSGKMVISPKLSQAERGIFGIMGGSLKKKPPEKTAKYLAYHRAKRFKK